MGTHVQAFEHASTGTDLDASHSGAKHNPCRHSTPSLRSYTRHIAKSLLSYTRHIARTHADTLHALCSRGMTLYEAWP